MEGMSVSSATPTLMIKFKHPTPSSSSSSSNCCFKISSPNNTNYLSFASSSPLPHRHLRLRPILSSSKGRDHDCSDLQSDDDDDNDSKEEMMGLLPLPLSLSPLSKDAAMGLVLSAATGRGWTTGSGMEGPPEPAGDAETTAAKVSTFPWSLFTKSPRRRMLIAFTCNICSQRTTRAINPHAYTDGTVFVQCCGCHAYHKLVDNLNLFDGMKCYINSSFKYEGDGANVNFEYRDIDNDDDGFFGI